MMRSTKVAGVGKTSKKLAAVIMAAGLGLACGDDPSGPGSVTQPADVTSAVIEVAPHPLVRDLAVDLDAASKVQVDYWTAGVPKLRRESLRAAASHKMQLSRLIPDAVYEYEVRGLGSDGERGDAVRGQFNTGSLPDDLAAVSFTARGQTTEPLTMLELRAAPFYGFVVVDREGEVVWYWRTNPSPRGYSRRANGNFLFLQGPLQPGPGIRITEVNARSQVVHDLSPIAPAHHDLIPTPQNTVYYLAIDDQTVNDTVWTGEAIWEWDPEAGTERKLWSSFDVMSPTTDLGERSRPDDWLHANSISIGPRGNVLMSLFFQPEVISIAPDFQSLEWRLFGPFATITSVGDAEAEGTHTASEVSDGRVLVFDNGVDREDGSVYSRALEVQIDADGRTATKVWEFRPSTDNQSRIISSARRLPNDNTLVAFGANQGIAGSTGPIEVFEVDQSQRAIWHLLIENAATMYRATPLSDIKGEVEVLD
jgi:hypothetical protein